VSTRLYAVKKNGEMCVFVVWSVCLLVVYSIVVFCI